MSADHDNTPLSPQEAADQAGLADLFGTLDFAPGFDTDRGRWPVPLPEEERLGLIATAELIAVPGMVESILEAAREPRCWSVIWNEPTTRDPLASPTGPGGNARDRRRVRRAWLRLVRVVCPDAPANFGAAMERAFWVGDNDPVATNR